MSEKTECKHCLGAGSVYRCKCHFCKKPFNSLYGFHGDNEVEVCSICDKSTPKPEGKTE